MDEELAELRRPSGVRGVSSGIAMRSLLIILPHLNDDWEGIPLHRSVGQVLVPPELALAGLDEHGVLVERGERLLVLVVLRSTDHEVFRERG